MWRDNWIAREFMLKPASDKGRSRPNRVSKLLDNQGLWNEGLVHENFRPIDSEVILKIKKSPRREADFLAWNQEKTGVFTVRSACKLALAHLNQNRDHVASSVAPNGNKPIWNLIWRSGCQRRSVSLPGEQSMELSR
jgi:hypothetical protein